MKIVGGKWTNWSGNIICKPRAIVAPKDEVELAATVRQAEGPVRVVGAGYSFTPLVVSDGTLIDLSAFNGLLGFDPERLAATISAATPLWDIGPLLYPLGQALNVIGDIDRQTLAGAIATGTHGSGRALGCLSAEVAGFRLLLASGEIIYCSAQENAEIFAAGRLALGLLGVVTEIAMKVRPAFKLVQKQFRMKMDELFEGLDNLIASNRHFEFLWFAYTDTAICRTMNETDEEAQDPVPAEALRQRGERGGRAASTFRLANEVLPYLPSLTRPAHRFFSRVVAGPGRVRWSHEMFPSARTVRFNEMEYAVPLASGAKVIREIVATIRKKRIATSYPVNFRTVAADDVWLSPFYQRDSVTIALLHYHKADPAEFFGACEPVFRQAEGRPHWAKQHTRSALELAHLYPQYEAFRTLRRKLDPKGKFLNAYLRTLFD